MFVDERSVGIRVAYASLRSGFARSNCPPLMEVLPVKLNCNRVFSHLILPLLALACAPFLSAQTLIVDKTSLTFSGQAGGSAVTQPLNITSSTGAATNFTLSYPSYPWLK